MMTAVRRTVAEGGDAIAVSADLSTEAGVIELARELEEREGRRDILVNNAGASWGAPLEEHPDAALDKVLAVHLKAPFHLIRA